MKHLVIRASAGTGKTYQLVQSYVRAIAEGLRPDEILAITFSRKAAFELRERVSQAIEASSGAESAELLKDIQRAPIANFHVTALRLLSQLSSALPPGFQIMGGPGEDLDLFLSACDEAWYFGEPSIQEELSLVSQAFDVDILAHDLFSALSRSRSSGLDIFDDKTWPSLTLVEAQEKACALCKTLKEQGEANRDLAKAKGVPKLAAWLDQEIPKVGLTLSEYIEDFNRWKSGIDRRGSLAKVFDKTLFDEVGESLKSVMGSAVLETLAPKVRHLAEVAFARYTALKKESASYDFGDLVEGFNRVAENDAGFLARIRAQYKLILVDEAQDTNIEQLKMIQHLAAIPTCQTTVVSVGDWKQSIYAFRGADPQSYAKLCELLLSAGAEENQLTFSRRSAVAVVDAVNCLSAPILGETYEALSALDDAPAGSVTWLDVEEASAVEEAKALCAYVKSKRSSGASFGDFAILLATTSRASEYARWLRANGIPVRQFGGKGFYNRAEVWDHLALGAWLTGAADRLGASIAMRSPLVGFSDNVLLELAASDSSFALKEMMRGEPLGDANDVLLWAHLRRHFEDYSHLELAPVASLVSIFDAFEGMSIYADGDLGFEVRAHLERLLRIAEDAELQGFSAGRFYREHLERAFSGDRLSIEDEGGEDSVVLATIHQSKGLEFDTVLLPHLHFQTAASAAQIDFDGDLGFAMFPRPDGTTLQDYHGRALRERAKEKSTQERARLFYVALSRAANHLVFVGAQEPPRGSGFKNWTYPHRERFNPQCWDTSDVLAPTLSQIDEDVEEPEPQIAEPEQKMPAVASLLDSAFGCMRYRRLSEAAGRFGFLGLGHQTFAWQRRLFAGSEFRHALALFLNIDHHFNAELSTWENSLVAVGLESESLEQPTYVLVAPALWAEPDDPRSDAFVCAFKERHTGPVRVLLFFEGSNVFRDVLVTSTRSGAVSASCELAVCKRFACEHLKFCHPGLGMTLPLF